MSSVTNLSSLSLVCSPSFSPYWNPALLGQLERLSTLILDGNKYTSHIKFPYMPSITTVCINKNKINNLPVFVEEIRRKFPNMKWLFFFSAEELELVHITVIFISSSFMLLYSFQIQDPQYDEQWSSAKLLQWRKSDPVHRLQVRIKALIYYWQKQKSHCAYCIFSVYHENDIWSFLWNNCPFTQLILFRPSLLREKEGT